MASLIEHTWLWDMAGSPDVVVDLGLLMLLILLMIGFIFIAPFWPRRQQTNQETREK